MSEFDKEAEREKLRQQYEQEQEDRKATQRMSELLLQGATMTGKHCPTCGDPIFRQNGTEFCPTCQRETGEVEEGVEAESPGADPTDTEPAETGSTGSEPTVETEGGERTATTEAERRVEERRTEGRGSEYEGPTESVRPEPPRRPRRSPPSRTDDARGRGRAGARPSNTNDLGDAREALARKVTRLAREAEGTDDVGRARELLAATREAAEALAAVERANR